jgi:hypothetical protein
MTTERWENNRLDRLAELLAQNAQGIVEMRVGLAETRAIVDSNARAIVVNSNAMVEF